MSDYRPEIGQAIFGQPWHRHGVPDSWVEALGVLSDMMNDPRHGSPFDNTGRRFDCKVFSAHAYSWDDTEVQRWNFKWRDVEISWYKYLGRGMSANMVLADSPDAMLRECMEALRQEKEKP